MTKTITLHPLELTVADAEGNNQTTLTVWEGPARIDADKLPEGWHRYAVRDCGSEGETLERRVMVNHLSDYATRTNLDALMESNGGWLDVVGTDAAPGTQPVELPAGIDHYRS